MKPEPEDDAAEPPPVTRVTGVVVTGHGVASGAKGDPRFPGGTLAMQIPHLMMRGVDLSRFHRGTLNVDVSPWRIVLDSPSMTVHDLRWHPTEPAEDFSFLDCMVEPLGRVAAARVAALIYWPHPETKPEHAQPPTVVEIMAPHIAGAGTGVRLSLEVLPGQGHFVRP